MPEYSPVRHRLPKEPLDHISEERSSQMRSFESSRKESDGRADSNGRRDSAESTARKHRRSAGDDSLERNREHYGHADPERPKDKEFLDSASDVSDLPALPTTATYTRHRANNGAFRAVPGCLSPSAETPRSNRSTCTMEALDNLEKQHSDADSQMDQYLDQERRNSDERKDAMTRNSSLASTYGGSSLQPGSSLESGCFVQAAPRPSAWVRSKHV